MIFPLTLERRVAIGECMNLVTLLVAAETPHAKSLAALVLLRLRDLATDTEAAPLLPLNLDIEVALELVDMVCDPAESEPAERPN